MTSANRPDLPHAPEREAMPEQEGAAAPLYRRVSLLLVCLAVGLAVGFAGQAITSQSAWFLAVPVCIAFGWLLVADPGECVAPQNPPRQDDAARGDTPPTL